MDWRYMGEIGDGDVTEANEGDAIQTTGDGAGEVQRGNVWAGAHKWVGGVKRGRSMLWGYVDGVGRSQVGGLGNAVSREGLEVGKHWG